MVCYTSKCYKAAGRADLALSGLEALTVPGWPDPVHVQSKARTGSQLPPQAEAGLQSGYPHFLLHSHDGFRYFRSPHVDISKSTHTRMFSGKAFDLFCFPMSTERFLSVAINSTSVRNSSLLFTHDSRFLLSHVRSSSEVDSSPSKSINTFGQPLLASSTLCCHHDL